MYQVGQWYRDFSGKLVKLIAISAGTYVVKDQQGDEYLVKTQLLPIEEYNRFETAWHKSESGKLTMAIIVDKHYKEDNTGIYYMIGGERVSDEKIYFPASHSEIMHLYKMAWEAKTAGKAIY